MLALSVVSQAASGLPLNKATIFGREKQNFNSKQNSHNNISHLLDWKWGGIFCFVNVILLVVEDNVRATLTF